MTLTVGVYITLINTLFSSIYCPKDVLIFLVCCFFSTLYYDKVYTRFMTISYFKVLHSLGNFSVSSVRNLWAKHVLRTCIFFVLPHLNKLP